jgi:hypothetical protein
VSAQTPLPVFARVTRLDASKNLPRLVSNLILSARSW